MNPLISCSIHFLLSELFAAITILSKDIASAILEDKPPSLKDVEIYKSMEL